MAGVSSQAACGGMYHSRGNRSSGIRPYSQIVGIRVPQTKKPPVGGRLPTDGLYRWSRMASQDAGKVTKSSLSSAFVGARQVVAIVDQPWAIASTILRKIERHLPTHC